MNLISDNPFSLHKSTIELIILCVDLVAGLVVQGTILTKKIHTLEEERL